MHISVNGRDADADIAKVIEIRSGFVPRRMRNSCDDLAQRKDALPRRRDGPAPSVDRLPTDMMRAVGSGDFPSTRLPLEEVSACGGETKAIFGAGGRFSAVAAPWNGPCTR
jgi:hypothetical protein